MQDPDNEIIGIQVRTGDWVFDVQGPNGTHVSSQDTEALYFGYVLYEDFTYRGWHGARPLGGAGIHWQLL